MTKKTLPKSYRFDPDELAILEAAAERHGSQKAAIMAALRLEAEAAAERSAISDEDLVDLLRNRLAGRP